MIRHLMVGILACGCAATAALGAEPETIDVIGHRRDQQRRDRPGQSVVFRPEDPSRFDLRSLLGQSASVTLPETGTVKASGFAVPRIRGQDTRLTEVYVEDELLQDPYSGLPLIDELDVRAFGELQHHQGLAPPELETVNSVGVLRYRERPLVKPGLLAGTTFGRPYGVGTWSLAGTPTREQGASGRVYLRHHQTDGRYPYYDTNGTPYNGADDRTRMRANNDRRSAQILPILAFRQGRQHYRLLALASESEGGVPAPGLSPGDARQRLSARLATLRIQHETGLSSGGLPTSLELRGTLRHDARTTDDPSQRVLGNRTFTSLAVASSKVGLAALWDRTPVTGRLVVMEDHAEVDGDGGLRVARDARSLYGGALIELNASVDLELKYQAMVLRDSRHSADNNPVFEAPDDGIHSTTAGGGSGALGWRTAGVGTYIQIGKSKRAPSLLEEFGDGGRIRGSPNIRAEAVEHREIGLDLRSEDASQRVGLALFQDAIDDRIALLPSVGETSRAQNIEHTRVRGLEARGEVTLARTRLNLTMTSLEPLDLTTESSKLLPGVAQRYATFGIEQPLESITIRWGSRYQSQIFRDLDNSIVIPAYAVHDLSLDGRTQLDDAEVALGIAVFNLTDVRRLPVQAPATQDNAGWSAYSDVEGYPLPGRQWRLSATVDL